MLLVLLDQLLGLQCHVFRLDEKRFGFGISQVRQGHQTFLLPSAQHQPSRRVREEEGSTAEDDGGDQLQSQGDPPGCLSSNKVCTVRDPITDQDTERDGQLLQCDKRSSNTGRRELSVVHGHQHRQSSDSHTTDPSSSPDEIDVVVRSDLQSCSEHEHHTPHRDRAFTRDLVGDRRSDKGSDESSTLQEHCMINFRVLLLRRPELAYPNSRIDVSRPFLTASTLSSRAS